MFAFVSASRTTVTLRRAAASAAAGAAAVYGVALIIEESSLPLGEAIQVVSTVVVAGATVAYVRLTRDLVAGQRAGLDHSERARREDLLLHAATFLNREVWIRLDKMTDKFPLHERVELSDAPYVVQELFDQLTELAVDITTEAVGLRQDDLEVMLDYSRIVLQFAKDLNLVLKTVLEVDRANAERTWEGAKAQYYLRVRDPERDPEWDRVMGKQALDALFKRASELVVELRRRAGRIDD